MHSAGQMYPTAYLPSLSGVVWDWLDSTLRGITFEKIEHIVKVIFQLSCSWFKGIRRAEFWVTAHQWEDMLSSNHACYGEWQHQRTLAEKILKSDKVNWLLQKEQGVKVQNKALPVLV